MKPQGQRPRPPRPAAPADAGDALGPRPGQFGPHAGRQSTHAAVLPRRRQLGRHATGRAAAATARRPHPLEPAPGTEKRNPWPIIAAVAVVLVVVVGGVGIWLLVKPKPVKTPDPIQSERLGALLISPPEVNGIMGSSGMQPGKPITSMDSSPVTVSPSACLGALYTTQDSVYAGTGYTGMSGVVSSEPGDNYDHWVNQAVVLFPSADKAKAFLQTSTDKWKSCANKTVTVTNTNKGKTYRWSFAEITGEPPKISVVEMQEAADGWGCQRALGVANNVIADVNACAYHVDKDQAGQIVDKIVERINSD